MGRYVEVRVWQVVDIEGDSEGWYYATREQAQEAARFRRLRSLSDPRGPVQCVVVDSLIGLSPAQAARLALTALPRADRPRILY